MQTARNSPGDYGRRFSQSQMAFEVAEDHETEDHYIVTLSYRPEGQFTGTPGQEQFFIEKEGAIALRQILSVPQLDGGRRFPFGIAAIGLVVVAVAAVGGVLAATGGGNGDGSLPVAAVLPNSALEATLLTPAPEPTTAPVVIMLPTATPIPTPMPTTTAQPTMTPTPVPTPTRIPVSAPSAVATPTSVPTATPIPMPTATPSPTSTPSPPITVSKTEDTNDGVCDGDCSLREAIAAVNHGGTIELPTGIYTLNFLSRLTIDRDLRLIGEGADNTIIQAGIASGVADFPVFEIKSGIVDIIGVTIRYGAEAGSPGGGIFNNGTLTLTNSLISDNSSGIFNRATLTLIKSKVSANTGRGITNFGGGTLTLHSSTVSDNSRGGLDLGSGSHTTLIDSTVSDNTANIGGGILVNLLRTTLTLTNTTISGNTATNSGGGIYLMRDNIILANTTITGNTARTAGGVFNSEHGSTPSVTTKNSIIAGNSASIRPDCQGIIKSLGHNLIGDATGCSFTPDTGDIVGTRGTVVDPLLGTLADNGSPTFTHALMDGSPAIDAGDNSTCPDTDQRGTSRPQGAACDIGAYEW